MTDVSPFASLALGAGAGGIYLTGEDNFRLTTWGALASATVALEGRFVTADGCTVAMAESQLPNSDRTAKVSIFPAREGVLTNVQLRVTTTGALRGHIFGILEIVRGREGGVQPLGTLLADYITSTGRLAWPGSPLRASADGPGRLRSITGTDPAAGIEISETVPTGARWRLISIRMVLVTDATVANRVIGLVLDDGVNPFYTTGNNTLSTAGTTTIGSFADGLGSFGNTSTAAVGMLPRAPILPAGSRIRTSTNALTGGDNYGAPQMLVEEWLEP